MRTFLTLAVMITDNILTSYKAAGEEEVNLSYEYRLNSVTIEVIEFQLSISSSKLKVSLFR